jgi:hypothetical protein
MIYRQILSSLTACPVPLYILQLVFVIVDPQSTNLYVVSIIHNFIAILCGVMATCASTLSSFPYAAVHGILLTVWSSTVSARSSLDSAIPPHAKSHMSEGRRNNSSGIVSSSIPSAAEVKGSEEHELGERKSSALDELRSTPPLQVRVDWSREVDL